MKRTAFLLVLITSSLLFLQQGVQGAEFKPIYQSPRPGAFLVQAESSIAFRFAEDVDLSSIPKEMIQVTGSHSGFHTGSTVLARDMKTVVFEPHTQFTAGEQIQVKILPGLTSVDGNQLAVGNFSFSISPMKEKLSYPVYYDFPVEYMGVNTSRDGLSFLGGQLNSDLMIPPNFPDMTVTVPANGTGDGYVFLSNFIIDWADRGAVTKSRPFLLILDNEGEPVFFREMTPGKPAMDFKKQPNGLLTYSEWGGIHYSMDSSYNIVKTYEAKNGYKTDIHDFQILPNGHALIMIYDVQQMDMRAYGGHPDAMVTGLVIQEQDVDGIVVFQWRSWDHFKFEESVSDLTEPHIDYVHGNSFEQDHDGNLIISNRAMNEVTKIDRQTGEIIWRLGGKKNEFTFINDPQPFFSQHDARRTADGNITIFDNHSGPGSTYARAVEYKLDETEPNKTATLVWEYRSHAMSQAMGNAQRLPNDNTMIGWGTLYPSLSEVKPNGEVAFELTLTMPDEPTLFHNSYRAFRFEWEGQPTTIPHLLARSETPGMTTLYTSWNGATNVSKYRVFGGKTADNLTNLMTVDREGFETKILVADADEAYCYFRVLPLDHDGKRTRFSNTILAEHCIIDKVFLPFLKLPK